MKILGLDYGKARIGVALSDEMQKIAFPKETIKASYHLEKTLEEVVKALKKYQFDEIVIGLPLLMNGQESPMAKEVRDFSEKLSTMIGKPIIFWDERLTSKQVEKTLIESSVRRKERSASVDTMAAALILQSYLDSKNRS